MSYDWDENEDETGDESNAVKALRKRSDEAAKRAKELEEANAKLQRQLAGYALDGVLKEKGYPGHIKKWILKDDVDVSDETALNTWFEENAADFGLNTSPPADDEVDPRAAALARMDGAQTGALPAGNKLTETQRAVQTSTTTSVDEMNAILARALKQ